MFIVVLLKMNEYEKVLFPYKTIENHNEFLLTVYGTWKSRIISGEEWFLSNFYFLFFVSRWTKKDVDGGSMESEKTLWYSHAEGSFYNAP